MKASYGIFIGMQNDLSFLCSVVEMLKIAGIETLVFGGWAEEMNQMIAPRPHKDIDLLYVAPDFSKLDDFISKHPEISEILAKHFPHKRALLYKGVMIELLLVQKNKRAHMVTRFWDEYELIWPDLRPSSISIPSLGHIIIAPTSILKFYRKQFSQIEKIRAKRLGRRDGA